MSFPHMTWAVAPAVFQVLVIQATASIAAYGFFFRDLAGSERWCLVIAPVLGFGALIAIRPVWVWAWLAAGCVLLLWLLVSARLRPASVQRQFAGVIGPHDTATKGRLG